MRGGRWVPWVLGALVTVVLVPSTSQAVNLTVDVGNFFFSPSPVTLQAGDGVTWHWAAGTHSVVEDETNAAWCAVRTAPAADCTKSFPSEGTFFYHCGVHAATMKATVVVGTPPGVVIASPADGASVAGTVAATGTASHDAGIDRVDVRVDSGAWQPAIGTTSWSSSVGTSGLINGAHMVWARATAVSGATGFATITVTGANPPTFDLRFLSLTGNTGTLGTTSISYQVRNDGNTAATGATALLEYQYKGVWKTFASDTFSVAAFSSTPRTKAWSNLFLAGSFPVRVTLDPTNAFSKLNEANNVGTTSAAFWTNAVPGTELGNP